MRHLGWLFAIAVAFLAIQVATNTNSAKLSMGPLPMDAMNIDEIQMQANKFIPAMVIDNPV